MKWRDNGGRGDLTERQWQKLQPLLPPQKAHTGQPCYDHRRILNGIVWLHRTGAPLLRYSRALWQTQYNYERDFTDGELSDYGNSCGKISCNKLMLLEILTGKSSL